MAGKRPSGGRILVSGLINLETTLRVEQFPLAYEPVRFPFFGVQTAVAGVGYNLTKALTTLGRTAQSQALLGQDWVGEVVRQTAAQVGLPTEGLHSLLAATAQSVILYDETGRRMIHTDLNDAQEQPFPPDLFIPALEGCDPAVLGNINWSRPFLSIARQLGKPIATDVHTIADLEDEYNRDFMAAADILFMSDEKLATSPEEWARAIFNRYAAEIVVIGLGGAGLFDGGDSLCVGR